MCAVLYLVSSLSVILCRGDLQPHVAHSVEDEGSTESFSSYTTVLYSEMMFFHLSCNKIWWESGWGFVLLSIYSFKNK